MRQLKHGSVELVIGNIVEQTTDAIVNAANTKLAGGGGVDGAIHRAAGPELMRLCLELPANEKGQRCETGDVRTTSAGNLKSKIVIHAVGPFFNDKYEEKAHAQLRSVHMRALREAVAHNCRSIALPAISTGAYRFPVADAAKTAIDSVCTFLEEVEGIEVVRFVLFNQSHYKIFANVLNDWKQSSSSHD